MMGTTQTAFAFCWFFLLVPGCTRNPSANQLEQIKMPIPKINKENKNLLHFLTLTTIEWINVFAQPEYFKILVDSLKYCQDNKGLLLYEYVFMTNHIHMILAAKEGFDLSEII